MVEQNFAVPIVYCMNEVSYDKENNDFKVEGYIRDNLHIASQAKVRSDSMSQGIVSRDKPLVMFLGSNETKGKTTMLNSLYQRQKFSIFGKQSNPLHKTSVDLIYILDRNEKDYHVLDVHGSVNDLYFNYCSNNKTSRMNCLVSLSSLCHCIVIQITQNQLSDKPSVQNFLTKGTKPKKGFKFEKLVSGSKAPEIVKLYKMLQVECCRCVVDVLVEAIGLKRNNIALVIRDCDEAIRNKFDSVSDNKEFLNCHVYCCPSEGAQTGKSAFEKKLLSCIDEVINKVDFNNNKTMKWWHKIDKYGLFLPKNVVKLYHDNMDKYQLQRFGLQHFHRLLHEHELFSFVSESDSKQQEDQSLTKKNTFPFSALFANYTKSVQNKEWAKKHKMDPEHHLLNVFSRDMSQVLRIFIKYCLPNADAYRDEFESWNQSELLYVLDDLCSTRNNTVLSDIHKEIVQLKSAMSKCTQDNKKGELKQKLDGKVESLRNTEVTGYDFVSDCQSMVNLIMQCRKTAIQRWQALSSETRDCIEEFISCVREFSHHLFMQGTPVEFCDGGYTRMDEDFVNYVFSGKHGGGNTELQAPVVSISVAGPQSSGKSTLLRRLFGIEARSSAGRTTNGLNCCKIDIVGKQLIVVDTEGIGSVEKNQSDKKRDHKIILGALASSRVFVLNIMRDATAISILDVILWAYDKLDLSSASNHGDGTVNRSKQLSDIKFIFVIRDCEQWQNLGWLEKQKNQINANLTASLQSAQITNKKIHSIDEIIGEPVWFPMPSAFNAGGSPNEYFSKRCVELRTLIIDEIQKLNKNNSYNNTKDWCFQMIKIWDTVVRFEDVLTPADFRKSAQIKRMQEAIDEKIKQFKQKLRPQVQEISIKCLKQNGNSGAVGMNDPRLPSFTRELNNLFYKEKEMYVDEIKKNSGLADIDDEIKIKFCKAFENLVDTYQEIEIKIFRNELIRKQKSERIDSIKSRLDSFIEQLKNEGQKDKKAIKKQYDSFFETHLGLSKKISSEDEKETEKFIEEQFMEVYRQGILIPNKGRNKIPSGEGQLAPYIKNPNKKGRPEYVKWNGDGTRNSGDNYEKEKEWMKKMRQNIVQGNSKGINTETLDKVDKWMSVFRDLELWLDTKDNTNMSNFVITKDFRCVAHYELKTLMIKTLTKLSLDRKEAELKNIAKTHKDEWEQFLKRVQNTMNTRGVAITTTNSIRDKIVNFCKHYLQVQVRNYFNAKFDDMKQEDVLRDAFVTAFGKDVQDAWEYIQPRGQIEAIIKHFDTYFSQYLRELKTNKGKNNKTLRDENIIGLDNDETFLEHWKKESMAISNNILQCVEDINSDECKSVNTVEKLVNVIKSKTDKKYESVFDGHWTNLDIEDFNSFKDVFVKVYNNTVTTPTNEDLERALDVGARAHQDILRSDKIGCQSYCPCCNAKCSKAKHNVAVEPHSTTFHLLLAFGHTHNSATKELIADICTTHHNVNEEPWSADNGKTSCTFAEFLERKYHNEWEIKEEMFEKAYAQSMYEMYAKKGLEDKLLKEKHKDKGLKKHTKCYFEKFLN